VVGAPGLLDGEPDRPVGLGGIGASRLNGGCAADCKERPAQAKGLSYQRRIDSKQAESEQVILERHLRALLKRLGIDEHSPPEAEQWVALLAHINDRLRHHDDDKHRLQRSLEIHGRELQTLYRELVTERDHLSSALACLPQGFVIFDRNGTVALMNAEAEQWLDVGDDDLSGASALESLQLDRTLRMDDLYQRLQEGQSIDGQGYLRSKDSAVLLADIHLQPIIREGRLAGIVLTFGAPQAEHPSSPLQAELPQVEIQSLLQRVEQLLGHPQSGPIQSSLRNIRGEIQEALIALTAPSISQVESTQEELEAIRSTSERETQALLEPAPLVTQKTAAPSIAAPSAQAPVTFQAAPASIEPLPSSLAEAPLPEVFVEPKKAVLEPKPPAAPPKSRGRGQRTGGLRILVVEDDSVSQQTIRATVQKLGHECTVAGDSRDALDLHIAEPFDAIISNYRMEGLDGIELCRRVRENPEGGYPYFILLTAMDKRDEATRALEAGVDAFLTKPLDANELAVRLKVAKGVQTRLNRVYSEFASGGEV
jgi:CheY-like chemotaxis protein